MSGKELTAFIYICYLNKKIFQIQIVFCFTIR